MYVYLICLIALLVTVYSSSTLPKCCDLNSSLRFKNNTFTCEKKSSLRYNIITGNILNKTGANKCVDIWNSSTVSVFTVSNQNSFSRGENVPVERIEHKCCPVGYEYEVTTHACTPSNKSSKYAFRFVKVGLPHCFLIEDYIFDDLTQLSRNKTQMQMREGEYCHDTVLNEEKFVLRVCRNNTEVCEKIKCIHKCCPDGQSFINGSFCMDTYVYGINFNFTDAVSEPDGKFAIIHGKSVLLYALSKKEQFHLHKNGTFTHNETSFNRTVKYDVTEQVYCIEHAFRPTKRINGHLFFKKPSAPKPVQIKFLILKWFQILSCAFLVATIAIYVVIKETDQIFGKILVSFSLAILITFVLHIFFSFNPKIPNSATCKSLAFFTTYMVLATFFWLNIMCLDIYWTFGLSKSGLRQKEDELKQFLFYCLYGWGCPLLIICITIFFHFVNVLPAAISISIGENLEGCTINKKNYAEHIFRNIPLTILQLINVYLFVQTIRYCLKVKREIQKMNDTNQAPKKAKFNANKERLGLIIKLAVVMGLTFIFEIVSTFYAFHPLTLARRGETSVFTWIEIVLDSVNSCQGVFIFLIFICKARILEKLRRKTSILKPTPRESSSCAYTRTSNVSMPRNSVPMTQPKLED